MCRSLSHGRAACARAGMDRRRAGRGYVLFSYLTLDLFSDAHVPLRETVRNDHESVSYQVARGEAISFCIGVHRRVLSWDPQKVESGDPLALKEYDEVRRRAADYIAQLGPVPPGDARPWAEPGIRDEAKPFRDKSVEQCVEGLHNDDAGIRRAAAWALMERGEHAAPATQALAALLDDPETRMPTLRTLEVVGLAASEIAPRLAALCSHSDGFVRLGATLVLVRIKTGRAVKALETGLTDEYKPVSRASAAGLVKFGPAAIRYLEELGRDAGPAVPRLREIISAGVLDADTNTRVEAILGKIQ